MGSQPALAEDFERGCGQTFYEYSVKRNLHRGGREVGHCTSSFRRGFIKEVHKRWHLLNFNLRACNFVYWRWRCFQCCCWQRPAAARKQIREVLRTRLPSRRPWTLQLPPRSCATCRSSLKLPGA